MWWHTDFYDPLGLVAPVVIQGKALLQNIPADAEDWDRPLSTGRQQVWDKWRHSLQEQQHFNVQRPYTKLSCSEAQQKELCVCTDAYLKILDSSGQYHSGFVLGKTASSRLGAYYPTTRAMCCCDSSWHYQIQHNRDWHGPTFCQILYR